MTAAIAMRVPAARLLTRTERGGRGFKSRPLGASILEDGISAFSFTVDLHFPRLLSAAENQFGPLEEPVNYVHVVLDAVVDHLLLTIRTDHDEHWRLSVLRRLADLDVGLLAVIEHPNRTDTIVTLQSVVEVHRVHGVGRQFGNTGGLDLPVLLFRQLLLPPSLIVFVVRIGECHPSNVVVWFGKQ